MNTKRVKSSEAFEVIFRDKVAYLYYEFEDAVVRASVSKDGKADYYVKLKGGIEFKANDKNNLVTESLLAPVLISKEDYDKF